MLSGCASSCRAPFTASHCRQDRERIGEARAFDDEAAEWRQQTAFAPRVQILDCGRKLAADRAADAARLEHHHRLVDAL
jgi:hypothetical protein